tara:strand:- start:123 stop:317 length:195 start_codon:yes stop_codon:yes gene_type:complete
MMFFKKTFSFLAITFSCIVLVSCEDDAMLDPSVEACTPGESYCNLSLPSNDNNNDSEINNPRVY